MLRQSFFVETRGRSLVDITDRVAAAVSEARVDDGLCTIFVHHTSASLIINENADPAVRQDLETWFTRLVVDGDPAFIHDDEGPDDMSAHIRTVLTQVSLGIPIAAGKLDLGTWQGVFLWEHRTSPHRRRISVVVQG